MVLFGHTLQSFALNVRILFYYDFVWPGIILNYYKSLELVTSLELSSSSFDRAYIYDKNIFHSTVLSSNEY